MYRGTTPAIKMQFKIDVSQASEIWVMIQSGESRLTLKKSDGRVQADGENIYVRLTERETIYLGQDIEDRVEAVKILYFQVKIKIGDNVYMTRSNPSLYIQQAISNGVMI